MKRTLIPLMLCAAFGLLLVACGGSDTSSNTTNTTNTTTTTNSNKGNANSTTTTTTNNTTSSANTSASGGDKIGVPECDEYVTKYETCINSKVPEANRAQVKTTLEQSRNAWRTAASTPQGKASLAGICKQAMETARTSMKSYGCDF